MAIFWRMIPVIDIWKGEMKELWGFEEIVTPLWFWQEKYHDATEDTSST